MQAYILLAISATVNGLLIWYVIKLLQKFIFISDKLSNLFLTTKAFSVFVKDLFTMDAYHGEPIIQELIIRVRQMKEEIEDFRDVFEYTLDSELDEELEEALNAEEDQNEEKPLFYAGP
jgi:hypothetical protein